jgi:hypothetical protein
MKQCRPTQPDSTFPHHEPTHSQKHANEWGTRQAALSWSD